MPLQDLYYPDKNNWDAGPIYGGWLAGQRENEAQLLRLMQLYNNAQEIQGKGLELDQTRQMNPLSIEKAKLGNLSAQQGIDLKGPEQGLANMQASNPAFMQGAFNVSKGAQESQLDDQELQKRIGHYDQMIEALQDSKSPLAVVGVAQNLGIPIEKIQPLLGSKDPLAAFTERRSQLLGQVADRAKADTLAKERGDTYRAKLASDTSMRNTDVLAASRESIAAQRGALGSKGKPLSTDQVVAQIYQKEQQGLPLTDGELWILDQAMKMKAASQQGALTLDPRNLPPGSGLIQKGQLPSTVATPPSRGATPPSQMQQQGKKIEIIRDPATGQLRPK